MRAGTEECDDGNTRDGDGCSAQCLFEDTASGVNSTAAGTWDCTTQDSTIPVDTSGAAVAQTPTRASASRTVDTAARRAPILCYTDVCGRTAEFKRIQGAKVVAQQVTAAVGTIIVGAVVASVGSAVGGAAAGAAGTYTSLCFLVRAYMILCYKYIIHVYHYFIDMIDMIHLDNYLYHHSSTVYFHYDKRQSHQSVFCYMYIHVYMYTCIYIYIYTYIYIYMCVCVYIYVHVNVYTCVYMYVYVYVYIYTHI